MTESMHEPDTQPDTQSDPALDNGDSTDWSSEGGAVTEGPATATDDGKAEAEGDSTGG